MFNKIFEFSKVALSAPSFGLGVWPVIYRNYKIYSQTGWSQTLLSLLEPLLIWTAFGYFLGHWVPSIAGVDYITYLFPTMIALSGAQVSYFESTLGSIAKLSKNNLYRSWSYTSLSDSEIVLGEILWSTLKGALACLSLVVVGWIADMVSLHAAFQILFISILGCYAFSAFGFFVATKKGRTERLLGITQVFFILPMFLFSNTFFPIDLVLPSNSGVVHVLPMANFMTLLRSSHQQLMHPLTFFSIGYLVVWGICFTNLATHQWKNRFRS